jgi:hypothetical protein
MNNSGVVFQRMPNNWAEKESLMKDVFAMKKLAAAIVALVGFSAGGKTALAIAIFPTVVANYTLDAGTGSATQGPGFNGSSPNLPIDSVGGHNFTGGSGFDNTLRGGGIGGPTGNAQYFNGNEFAYTTLAGSTTLPTTNDFEVSVYVFTGGTAGANDALFSSNGGAAGSLQIGTDGSGNLIALINDGSGGNNNFSGQSLGTVVFTTNATNHLQVQSVGGVFTFYKNGVAAQAGLTPTNSFSGFGGMHLGINPGGGRSSDGLFVTDLTIAVPEPGSLAMLAFGSVFLWFAKRRHKG